MRSMCSKPTASACSPATATNGSAILRSILCSRNSIGGTRGLYTSEYRQYCRSLIPNIGDGAIEWGTDTTRAIAQMIFGGAQERFVNVRMIFSHGGGTMPFLVERFANMARSPQLAPKFPQGFAGAAAKYILRHRAGRESSGDPGPQQGGPRLEHRVRD